MVEKIIDYPEAEKNALSQEFDVPYEAYHLTQEAMTDIENDIVKCFEESSGLRDGIGVFLVQADNYLSDFGRTSETIAFENEGYDFHQGMEPYETRSEFLYTIDMDIRKIAHVKRLVTAKSEEDIIKDGTTGVEVIDDRLTTKNPAEQASLEEILTHHQIDSPAKIMNVTSNLNTKRGQNNVFIKPYSLYSYKAVFNLAYGRGLSALVAYMNSKAFRSLRVGLGIESQLLAGKEFHLPAPEKEGGYDTDYLAVAIFATQNNLAAFSTVNRRHPGSLLIANIEVPIFS